MAKTYGKMKDPASRQKMTEFYVSIQIVGTADDCIQQLGELQRLTGMDHVVCDFSYGRMPPASAELNMRHFAERALPVLQRDPAFVRPVDLPKLAAKSDDLFAPA
jgi:hypothetical protein